MAEYLNVFLRLIFKELILSFKLKIVVVCRHKEAENTIGN